MDTEKEQPISEEFIDFTLGHFKNMTLAEIEKVLKKARTEYRIMKGKLNDMLDDRDIEVDRSPMKLGTLIHQLETFDPKKSIKFDFGGQPGDTHSYRGYYNHLAVGKNGQFDTVGEFREQLQRVKGANLRGYKGGDYKMTENVPVWVSNYGRASSISLCGLYEPDYESSLVILTSYYEW